MKAKEILASRGRRLGRKILAFTLTGIMMLTPAYAFASSSSSSYSTSGATTFTFSDDGIDVDEGNYDDYEIDGTDLKITGEGTYIVTGDCDDGTIVVKKGVTDVTLVLDGLDLTSADSAPITFNKSSEGTIIAASGSTNNLADTEKNNDETYTDNSDAENAVIKLKDGSDVTIAGTGTINIDANGKNGIKSGASTDEEGDASLTIEDVTLNVDCDVNDGINAEATLNIVSGNITVSAADDGIHSDYYLNFGKSGADDDDLTVNVKEAVEGIEGAEINFYSGTISTSTTDDGINAANSDLSNYDFKINIYGGDITVDTPSGDGIDSNGSISVSGGTTEVYGQSSGDNSPLDYESSYTITGGTVLGVGTSGMGDGKPTTAGQAYVTFGGGMGGGFGGMRGGMMGGTAPTADTAQQGTNGTAPADMNGSAPAGFGGGTAPSGFNGNTGGFGGMRGGMMNGTAPTGSGQQGMNGTAPDGSTATSEGSSSVSVSAGDTIEIVDSSGNTVYTATAARSAGYVFFSSGDLTEGETYTLELNGSSAATATASTEAGTAGFGGPGGQRPTDGAAAAGGQAPADGQAPAGQAQQGTTNSSGFSDVADNAWYYEAVKNVTGKSYMSGTDKSSFSPDTAITRGMVATVLYRMAGAPAVSGSSSFSDVPAGQWYSDAIAWCEQNSIVTGLGDGTFGVNTNVTREQLATLILRYAQYAGKDVSAAGSLNSFSDSSKVASWAEPALSWANGSGLIKGYDDGSLKPQGTATRAEFAQILTNFTK